ncbi:hypothetical protein GOV07_00475 [Candidatus Woesearchaeota archaeon]|nr:hypothetical protein [Candidatus Woesearchaeota archaeon]
MNLKELQGFAKEENKRLEQHYKLEADEKTTVLAHMTKITEETGELAEAILMHLGLQRKAKLVNHTHENLEKEFADVIYAASILAEKVGVDLDSVMTKRIEEIKKRTLGDDE